MTAETNNRPGMTDNIIKKKAMVVGAFSLT